MDRVLTAIMLCILSVLFIGFEWFNASLFFSLLSYALILYHTYKTTGINSLLFLFLVLFGLYGYSVPVSVFFDMDIGWHRVAKLKTWQKVDYTLFSYMLSNQLAFLAITLLYFLFVNNKIMHIKTVANSTLKISYFRFALIAGLISSLSEAINFLRAGAFYAVFQGKAYYQGAVSDLALNIPYEGFFYISVALFSQFFSSVSSNAKYITYLLPYILSISFVLFIDILIGERGTLLVAVIVFFLGYTINKRITSIKPIYIVLISILYISFNILTLLREQEVEYKGFTKFFGTYKERLYKLMNPANTEFGSPALNYRIFIDKKSEHYDYKWGKTYTEIAWAFIPTYIYPNKPQSIIYEFRDQYFPERKELGSTAGTGFSSLMEAYMNFGYFGPFIVYLLSIFFLIYAESKRGRNNMFMNLMYLLLFNIFLIFSRSASQYILYNLVLYVVQIGIVVMIYKIIPKRAFSLLKFSDEKS